MLECLAVLSVEHELSFRAPIDTRTGCLRIAPRNDPSADKQIEISVTVQIAEENGAHAPVGRANDLFDFICGWIAAQDRSVGFRVLLIAGRSGEDGGWVIRSAPNQHRSLVP